MSGMYHILLICPLNHVLLDNFMATVSHQVCTAMCYSQSLIYTKIWSKFYLNLWPLSTNKGMTLAAYSSLSLVLYCNVSKHYWGQSFSLRNMSWKVKEGKAKHFEEGLFAHQFAYCWECLMRGSFQLLCPNNKSGPVSINYTFKRPIKYSGKKMLISVQKRRHLYARCMPSR